MDHRWHKRHLSAIPAQLLQDSIPIGEGTISNISRDGMFVQISFPHFEAGSFIEVRLAANDDEDDNEITVPAIVVHQSQEGVGLMFKHPTVH